MEYRLGDFCEIKHGYAYKSKFFSSVPTSQVVLTPANFKIGGGFQIANKPKYYIGEGPSEYILRPGDLIVTMTDLSRNIDTLGYPALIPLDGNTYLHNQRIGLVTVDESVAVADFIYWLLRTKQYQRFIANSATGSTVKHTSPTLILSYKCSLPNKLTQKRIAAILNAFEEKITNNSRLNDYLAA